MSYPAPAPRADQWWPTADDALTTIDADDRALIPPGWPCAVLAGTPPSLSDAQSDPDPEAVLGQIAGVLTPRGPAWGTDEAGDGRQAGPVMRTLWRALAAWVARHNTDDWRLATQAVPSAVTDALADWEAELGLPDPCAGVQPSTAARVRAVRARFAAYGGQSPAYFICLAAALGATIWIEEPTQFFCDESEVTGDSIFETWFRIDEGEIDETPLEDYALGGVAPDADELGLDPLIETSFEIDDGEIDETPLEDSAPSADGSVWKYWIVHISAIDDPADRPALECLIRAGASRHTVVLFSDDR